MATGTTGQPGDGTASAVAAEATADITQPATAQRDVPRQVLTAKEKRFLARVARFLVTVGQTDLATRAMLNGYTLEEHQLGWELQRKSAGEMQPLGLLAAMQRAAVPSSPAQRLLLEALDAFENNWFPRTRAILQRFGEGQEGVEAEADTLEATFFLDLSQQPLGPGVVSSVRLFLDRFALLGADPRETAQKAASVLRQRGLTEAEVSRVRELLAQAEVGAIGRTVVGTVDLDAAHASQRESFRQLDLWWKDWATMLRSKFNGREQIQLGLTVAGPRGPVAINDPSDEDDTPEED